jgi:hypothetical protein
MNITIKRTISKYMKCPSVFTISPSGSRLKRRRSDYLMKNLNCLRTGIHCAKGFEKTKKKSYFISFHSIRWMTGAISA